MEFLELAKFLPTHWTETSRGYCGRINKSKIDQMFKKRKQLFIWFIQLYFYHRRLTDPAQVFPKDLQGWAQADLQRRLLLFPSFSTNPHNVLHLCNGLTNTARNTKASEPERNAEWEPNSVLHFSAYLPICWYLHSVPSLTHSTYIILYCSAGKRFSIICNYFLIWPIWEVIAAEKNE